MQVTNVFSTAARGFVITCLVFALGCTARFPESPTPTPALARIQLHYENSHEFLTPGSTNISLILYAVNTEAIYENVSSRATWFSTNTAAVEVMSNNRLRAVRDGSADIIANYQGLTASARVIVRSTAPSLDLSPPSTVFVAETRAVTARLSSGSRPDVTDRCTFTTSDPTIVSIEGNRITGLAPGTAMVTAQLDPLNVATFYISVPPRGLFR